MAGSIKGITIEINGDTSKLSSALREADSALKETQSQLNAVEKSLKFDPSNVDLLRDKFQLMKERIDETTTRLDTLKEAQRQMDAAGVDKSSDQYRALQVEIDTTESKLNGLEGEMKEFGTVSSQQLKIVGDKFTAIGEKISGVGQKLRGIGQTMTTHLTVPIVAAGTASVKMASDYEENLNKVDVAFNNSAGTVKEWAKTATDQFGLSENAALEAAALFGDMGTSMGLSDKEAADMAVTLTGLAGDLSSFKNIGIDQAMTALKSVFTGETESLKNLGVVMTQTNLEEFADKTGRVYKEMSQAEKVALRYEYVLESTKNAQGDYARTSDGAANSIRTMQASAENLGVVFGEEILPYIVPLIQGLTDLVNQFASLDEETKQNIVTALGVIAALGPIVSVIGTVVTVVGGAVSAFGALSSAISAISAAAPAIGTALGAIGAALTGPIGIIAAIIAALVALGVAIYANWDKIKAFCADVKDGFNRLKADVAAKWDEIKANTSAKWNEIKDSVKSKVTEAANTIRDKWNTAKETTSKVWGALKDKVRENGGGIEGLVKTYAQGWQNIIKFAWNAADKATGGALSNMLNSVIDKAKSIKENIETKIGEAVDFIKELPAKALQWGKDLIANFIDGIKNAPSNLADAMGGVADTVASFIHFSEPDEGPLKDFHTFAPDMIRLFVQGIEQTLPVLRNASTDMAASVLPGMNAMQNGGGASTTYNTPVNITVYGAQGQDVNALADVIQSRLNRAIVNQKAVFA